MRLLLLVLLAISACAPVHGPVDRVAPEVSVTAPPAPRPVPGSVGLPFHIGLF